MTTPIHRQFRFTGRHPLAYALFALFVSLLLSALVLVVQYAHERDEARGRAYTVMQPHLNLIGQSVHQALSTTFALAALVRQGEGELDEFETIATELMHLYPGVDALQLAPDGVIRQVVPLVGNEAVLGHNLFADPQRNAEAFLARETGNLTMAGPFELIQGGVAAIGRMPVFLGRDNRFWGFTTALIRFPDVLEMAGLPELAGNGYHYVLWHRRYQDGRVDTIASSIGLSDLSDPVEQELRVPNGHWYLSVSPINGWVEPHQLLTTAILCLLFSVASFALVGTWARQPRLLQQEVELRTQQLRHSEERLRALYDVLPVGVAITNPDGIVLDCNSTALELLGCTRESLVGGYCGSFETGSEELEGDAGKQAASVMALQRGMAIYGVEFESRLPDGREHWLSVSAVPIDHPTLGVAIAYVDITEHHQRENELQQYKRAIEQSPASVVVTDINGVIQYANPKVVAVSGHAREALIGRNANVFRSPATPKETYQQLWSTILKGDEWRGEMQNQTRSGDHYWESVSISPIRNAQGKVINFVAVKEDITRQKQTEHRLQEYERRLKLALGAANGGTFYFDLQCDTNHWDRGSLDIYGIDEGTFDSTYQGWLDLLVAEDREETDRSIRSALDDPAESGYDLYFRIDHPSGEIRTIHAQAWISRTASGEAEFVSGLHFDVTEQKRLEETLRRAKEAAESATRAKSEFLANMSHEIRTPMNAVLGLIYLLEQTQLDHQQRDYLRKTRTSAASLLGIINDILDFSKIEANRLAIESTPFDLDQLLEELISSGTALIGNKPIELFLSVANNLPLELVGDPLRLGQVLKNLLSNAIKFTERGRVTLQITGSPADGQPITFVVSDSGIGMDRETLSRLFTPFTQADSSTTRRFGGTGLGLTITRRLIELMGGELAVVSEVGQGSEFRFDLPLKVAEDAAISPLVPHLSGWQAVVVGGSDLLVSLMVTALENEGFSVTHAGDVDEAQSYLQTGGVDLVVAPTSGGRWGDPRRLHNRSQMLSTPPAWLWLLPVNRSLPPSLAGGSGKQGHLNYPFTPRQLWRQLAGLSGGPAPHWRVDQPVAEEEQRLYFPGARVLLVEDSHLNQLVAGEILVRMGIKVEMASNGVEALDRLRNQSEHYDLVLMDLQMPEMDGLEATRRARQLPNRQELPIIALTANAMKGDQEMCLNAGMNGYLTKPLNIGQLRAELGRWLASYLHHDYDTSHPVASGIVEPDMDYPGIDLPSVRERLLDDMELFHQLLGLFASDYSNLSETLVAAIDSAPDETKRRIHTLKGAAGNISAIHLAESAERLEERIEKGEAAGGEVEELLTRLDEVLATCRQYAIPTETERD